MRTVHRTKTALAAVGLAVSLTGCEAAADAADAVSQQTSTCEHLAEQAVEISADEDVALLKVRDLTTVTDNREGFEKPATGEALVLSCSGTGVWSDNTDSPVVLEETVDSDGDSFIAYAEQ